MTSRPAESVYSFPGKLIGSGSFLLDDSLRFWPVAGPAGGRRGGQGTDRSFAASCLGCRPRVKNGVYSCAERAEISISSRKNASASLLNSLAFQ